MRDYTYLGGARFSISNIYRSQRYDIDRLDLSLVDDEKPEFSRGLRIVDNDDVNTVMVDGEDADNLMYSLSYIYTKNDNIDSYRLGVDTYLRIAIESSEYLITSQKKSIDEATSKDENLLH